MNYIGGKFRIARHISNKMLELYPNTKTIVDPFCGGLHSAVSFVKEIPGVQVACSDVHGDLVRMWQDVKDGWEAPTEISEEQYQELKSQNYYSPLKVFVGYGCSFSGKWWGGYSRDKNSNRNYCLNAANSLEKIRPYLNSITFSSDAANYEDLIIKTNGGTLVYCDPPYEGTTKVGQGNRIDYEAFWNWCRNQGNPCFVSELQAPNDIPCVWEKNVATDMTTKNLNRKSRVEKLFLTGDKK